MGWGAQKVYCGLPAKIRQPPEPHPPTPPTAPSTHHQVTTRKAAAIAASPDLAARVGGAGCINVGACGQVRAGLVTCPLPRPTLRCSPPPFPPIPLPPAAGTVSGPRYALLPLDLRAPGALASSLAATPGFDPAAPTLVLAECVLVYLPPAASAAVVADLGRLLPEAAMAVYEQARDEGACMGRAGHPLGTAQEA